MDNRRYGILKIPTGEDTLVFTNIKDFKVAGWLRRKER